MHGYGWLETISGGRNMLFSFNQINCCKKNCGMKTRTTLFSLSLLVCSCVWRLQRQPGKWWWLGGGINFSCQLVEVPPTDSLIWVWWTQGKVWLIDLNPFGEVTDSLLFTWEELTSGEAAQQQVRKKVHTQRAGGGGLNFYFWLKPCMSDPRAGRAGVPLHHQWGDGAAQPVSELQDPAGLCGPLHRRRRLQAHRLPQAGGVCASVSLILVVLLWQNIRVGENESEYQIWSGFKMCK